MMDETRRAQTDAQVVPGCRASLLLRFRTSAMRQRYDCPQRRRSLTLMRTAKSKATSSQQKREKPGTTVAAPMQVPLAKTRTYGLPGTAAERAARRSGLMEEHRETLCRLGE
jgi:hypothetical protein